MKIFIFFLFIYIFLQNVESKLMSLKKKKNYSFHINFLCDRNLEFLIYVNRGYEILKINKYIVLSVFIKLNNIIKIF